MLTKKQKWLLGIAAIHVILVGFGALSYHPWGKLGSFGWPGKIYGAVSGSNSGYGFFAPGVGTQLKAKFTADTASGEIEVPLGDSLSREADLRLGNLLGWFWNEVADRKLQRSLAASWAGKIFGKTPEAKSVTVKLETYYLPSMSEYEKGVRPEWRFFYEAKFVHQPRKPDAS